MESPFKGKTGFKRLINAFGYSLQGFKSAYKHEDAFRQEVLMAVILLPLAIYLGHSGIERALLAGSVILVLIVELVNSSIEATVDYISIDFHHLAARAKDIGSAAVLLSLSNMALIWCLIILS